ncbi:very-long-chain 3-oxoacyl-CoA reductase-B-like isoform X2 [Polyodon spathula]|uniref:very-long-chain 3-oxoacyl-CoA reductase-B-like isoform X2 n=1 Tax=Polyodon spathula TaxID=7913 RepID=UPI001B7E55BA|nr:very-long-chain 3-oxoacyl-CoA reductase-B-like isoform X2 [Polyodon spathula]
MSFPLETIFFSAVAPLYWLGALTAGWLFLRAGGLLATGFRVWVLGNGQQVGPQLGKWAVVTGATDGIGKAYAEELARRGMCVALISRSQEKLDQVSNEIREKFQVDTTTIAVDFGQGVGIYQTIEKGLAGLEIGVLVNNVGISYNYPEYFLDVPDLDNMINNMISINVTSVCQMTRLVLPGMVERSKGAILNISSASGMYPVPLLTLYSSTKAFVDFFSRAMHAEYKSRGIIVQSVLPFYVATKLSKIRRPTLDKPSPAAYVKAALSTVGLQVQTNGYLPHALMGWVTTSLMPLQMVMNYSMKMNKELRTRYLKKQKAQ